MSVLKCVIIQLLASLPASSITGETFGSTLETPTLHDQIIEPVE